MVGKSIVQMTRFEALSQDMIGLTLAERCGGQFALNGADRRGWRFGPA